jgi:hypothetical protein
MTRRPAWWGGQSWLQAGYPAGLDALESASAGNIFCDVRLGFEVQVALAGILAVVVLERSLDITGCVSCPSIRLQ